MDTSEANTSKSGDLLMGRVEFGPMDTRGVKHFDVGTDGNILRLCKEPGCRRPISTGWICDICEDRLNLRQQVEKLGVINKALADTLADVTAAMFGTVDSGGVYMHIDHVSNTGKVALLDENTAKAFHKAKELIEANEANQ